MNIAILLFWIFITLLLILASWQVVVTYYAKDDSSEHSDFFFVSGLVGAILLGLMTLAAVWIHNNYVFSLK